MNLSALWGSVFNTDNCWWNLSHVWLSELPPIYCWYNRTWPVQPLILQTEQLSHTLGITYPDVCYLNTHLHKFNLFQIWKFSCLVTYSAIHNHWLYKDVWHVNVYPGCAHFPIQNVLHGEASLLSSSFSKWYITWYQIICKNVDNAPWLFVGKYCILMATDEKGICINKACLFLKIFWIGN